ncbi:MAG: membrane protein insertase YidC, partial [Bacteroides sp.]
YFLSALISVATMIILRKTVNEDKILAELEANKNNPKKKKSGLMAKMEAMQKEQERLTREKAKQNKR